MGYKVPHDEKVAGKAHFSYYFKFKIQAVMVFFVSIRYFLFKAFLAEIAKIIKVPLVATFGGMVFFGNCQNSYVPAKKASQANIFPINFLIRTVLVMEAVQRAHHRRSAYCR